MGSDTIKRLLGTKLPIIQAPMAGVQDSALTIAVCQAGGLGSLPCGMLNTDNLVSEIRRMTCPPMMRKNTQNGRPS